MLSVYKHMEQWNCHIHTADGNVKWYRCFGKLHGSHTYLPDKSKYVCRKWFIQECFFITAPIWKQPKCPLTGECIKNRDIDIAWNTIQESKGTMDTHEDMAEPRNIMPNNNQINKRYKRLYNTIDMKFIWNSRPGKTNLQWWKNVSVCLGLGIG